MHFTSERSRVIDEALGEMRNFETLAPENLPRDCRKINCDCPAVYNFMGEWRKVCYRAKRGLKRRCVDKGRIEGGCDASMKGPNDLPGRPGEKLRSNPHAQNLGLLQPYGGNVQGHEALHRVSG